MMELNTIQSFTTKKVGKKENHVIYPVSN